MERELSHRLTALAIALSEARWPEQAWRQFLSFANELGFHQVTYQHRPPLGAEDEGRVMVVADGFPEAWIASYIRKKRYRQDPIVSHALTTTEPFLWSEVGRRTPLGQDQQSFLAEMRAAGLGDGIALQAFGPANRNGYFGLGFGGKADPALTGAETVLALRWACQTAHARYCAMLAAQRPALPTLSDREREILEWIARGKSNSVIADIVGLSNHTVDAYVRRIFSKLGTRDRLSATLRALGAGLISGAV